jgi:hypothetical protein
MHTKFWYEKPEEKSNLRVLGVDARIILTLI